MRTDISQALQTTTAGLLRRAQTYAALTPGERALLRLAEGLLCAALVAALPIVADALGRQAVNWSDVGRAALAAGVTAALLALNKYLRAHGDPPLTATLANAANETNAAKGAK